MCYNMYMGLTHDHKKTDIADNSISDRSMKQVLYWIIVFLAFICVICLGVILIHWSVTTKMP